VLAVTSGKGGVGKTNVAVNLGISLRLFGVNVLLLDADVGLGNVDVLLGLDTFHNLRDVLLEDKPIEHVVVEGPRGMKILPGASGVEQLTRLSEEKLGSFMQQVQAYCSEMDFVVVDTSSGISSAVIACLAAADEMILVTNSEPTSLTDAYALLKVMNNHQAERKKPVSVVMNQTSSKEEALRSYDRLRGATRRFLGWDVDYLGSVARDDTVSEATKRQVDFLTHYESSACTRDMKKIAARLVSAGRGGCGNVGRFFEKMIEGDGHE